MAWVMVVIAGLFEVGWATGLKYSEGFTRPVPSVVTIVMMLASFGLLALAMRSLPLGTAYTVWVGIGAVGTVIAGIILFKEPVELTKLLCTALIVAGVIGLKLVTPAVAH